MTAGRIDLHESFWILLGLVAVLACDRDPNDRAARPPTPELQGAVLFILDTVRADHLPTSTSAPGSTPALERLAHEGVVFDQVVSSAPWTLPSMISTLSGGTFEKAFEKRLTYSVVESIRDAGYSTAAITEGGFVTKRFGLDLGFQHFEEEVGPVQLLAPGQARDPNPPGGIASTFRRARDWITEHRDERFFLLIHTYEPHTPYTRTTLAEDLDRGQLDEIFEIEDLRRVRSGELRIGDVEKRYLEALYRGGVIESDRYLGMFLNLLEELGLRDETLIVVTSDHGEDLGERYSTRAGDHGHALYDEQVLVPLVIHNPVETYPIARIRAQVRTMDILPTIAEILGADYERDRGGMSLLPLLRDETSEDRIAFGGMVDAGPPRSFVRYLGYKYIETLGPEKKSRPLVPSPPDIQLFDVNADPGEQHNLASAHPELVERFHHMLVSLLRDGHAEPFELPSDMDPQTRERLRSLGYLE